MTREPCLICKLKAASSGDSIENTAKTLATVPCGNNIRYHFDKINNFEQLESELNLALKSRLPCGIRNKQHSLAIDLNLIPYYGNPSKEELPYIYRSQGKAGTCSFYAYATIYLIKKGKRVTLAMRGVRWADTSVAIATDRKLRTTINSQSTLLKASTADLS